MAKAYAGRWERERAFTAEKDPKQQDAQSKIEQNKRMRREEASEALPLGCEADPSPRQRRSPPGARSAAPKGREVNSTTRGRGEEVPCQLPETQQPAEVSSV